MQEKTASSGKVVRLYISKTEPPKREEREKISCDSLGVVGDKFYAKDPERTILISSTKSYEISKEQGIELEFGKLGENILLDFDAYSIPLGVEFSIGEVVFVMTQNCTLCKSLTSIDNRLPKLLKDDRGIFARVLQCGIVKIGDEIKIKQREMKNEKDY